MCRGATRGLAGLKFSTSPSMLGMFEFMNMKATLIVAIGMRSFTKNMGLNFILSILPWEFTGLEDPFSCSIIK